MGTCDVKNIALVGVQCSRERAHQVARERRSTPFGATTTWRAPNSRNADASSSVTAQHAWAVRAISASSADNPSANALARSWLNAASRRRNCGASML